MKELAEQSRAFAFPSFAAGEEVFVEKVYEKIYNKWFIDDAWMKEIQ